ncbi:MAG: hypothetical protein WC773_03200 [Patescibacteria group bacterium]|jgi:hypothetical protein
MQNNAETINRNWNRIIGLVLGGAVLIYLTSRLLRPVEQPWIFLDYVNLIFHESGHVLFSPFGDVLRILGGSLTQLIIPIICLIAFWSKKQFGSAAFALFWLGDSLINVAVYIKDAQARSLPLITDDPESHDWHWLLDHWSLLQSDQQIGGVIYFLGALALFGAIGWVGYLIYQTWNMPNSTLETASDQIDQTRKIIS